MCSRKNALSPFIDGGDVEDLLDTYEYPDRVISDLLEDIALFHDLDTRNPTNTSSLFAASKSFHRKRRKRCPTTFLSATGVRLERLIPLNEALSAIRSTVT
ncbi:MAG TPA: hypothetical protein VEB70_07090 [Noviherbaspirillum sp.]|nr:hypothetical protein [Noviherbaspirillum sp.]